MTAYWKDVNGRNWTVCSCLKAWLPVYQAELIRLGELKYGLDMFQTIGFAAASAGTHGSGGAWDDNQTSDKALQIAREMGAAKWKRTKAQGFDITHGHGVLNGCPHAAPLAKAQVESYKNGRNGLANNGKDDGPEPRQFPTWQDGIKWAKERQKPKTPAKPAKPAKPVKPWFNVSFSNTWWNSVPGGKVAAVSSSAPTLAKDSAAGNPAIATFCEVRQSQLRTLDAEMKGHDYRRVAYAADNMLAAYVRPHVDFIGQSFSRFTKQDGGNREGVLRLKFRIDGSRAQIGVLHLDHDSPESYKRHNLKQAYNALRRFGIVTLLPDWKSRTLIIGDFNDSDVAAKVLKPLGFKQIETKSGIDQAWVGSKRVDRGGTSSKTASDHKRIVVRLGRS